MLYYSWYIKQERLRQMLNENFKKMLIVFMIITVILKQKTVKRHIYKMIYYVSFVKTMLNGRDFWLVSFLFIKRLAHEKNK